MVYRPNGEVLFWPIHERACLLTNGPGFDSRLGQKESKFIWRLMPREHYW